MSYIQAINFYNSSISPERVSTKQYVSTDIFSFDNNNQDNNISKSTTVQKPQKIPPKTKKRTILNAKEKITYAKIYSLLDKNQKIKLENCLKTGKLLELDIKKESSVLDNLYKIITLPRTKEVNAITILNECINIIDNPCIINQLTEDMPEEFLESSAEYVYEQEEKIREQRRNIAKVSDYMKLLISESGEDKLVKENEIERIKKQIKDVSVGTCAAASIEYILASKFTADFINVVDGLTSEKKEVKKIIDCNKINLTNDIIDEFKTHYEIKNGKMELTLKVDDGAYILSNIQKEHQDSDERSTIDILFQSLIFQIATKNTYNSIIDSFGDNLNEENPGLDNYEEEYLLKILTGKNVKCDIYRYFENNQIISEITDTNLIIKNLDNYLSKDKYLLVGINCYDQNNALDGHAITITGQTKDKNGKEFYICKDTAELEFKPKLIEKKYIAKHILDCVVID